MDLLEMCCVVFCSTMLISMSRSDEGLPHYATPTTICYGKNWIIIDSFCLMRINIRTSWTDARQYCWNYNAHLLILSEEFPLNRFNEHFRGTIIGEWVGVHVFNEKLWWNYKHPKPARPNEYRYNWSKKTYNLTTEGFGVISKTSNNEQNTDFTLDLMPASERRPFTCVRESHMDLAFAINEFKCRSSWFSSYDLNHCFSGFMEDKDFSGAQKHCDSLNSSLWTPEDEYDFTLIQYYMTEVHFYGDLHMGIPKNELNLPFANDSALLGNQCPYMSQTNLYTDNCLVRRQFICQEQAKYLKDGLIAELKIKNISKDAISVEHNYFIINSFTANTTLLNCSGIFGPVIWIKNGLFYEDLSCVLSLKDFIPAYTNFEIYTTQGTYSYMAHIEKYGQLISNEITFIFKDVLTTWLYLVTEIDMSHDFSLFVLDEGMKHQLRSYLGIMNRFRINGVKSQLFPDSIVKTRKEDLRPGRNVITLKFVLYTQLEKDAISKHFYYPDVQVTEHLEINLLNAYLREAYAVVNHTLMKNISRVNEFINMFGNIAIPTRKRRDIIQVGRNASHEHSHYSKIYIKDTRACPPESITTPQGSIRFEIGLAGKYLNSTSICLNSDFTPLALGKCDGNFEIGYSWKIEQFYRCVPSNEVTSNVSRELYWTLNSMGNIIPPELIRNIEKLTSKKHLILKGVDVRIVSEIVQAASKSLKDLNEKNFQILANIVSNTMQAPIDKVSNSSFDEMKLADSKFKLSKSLESVISNVQLKSPQTTWTTDTFVVRIQETTKQSRSFGLIYSEGNQSNVIIEGNDVNSMKFISAGITIPETAFNDKDMTRTSVVIYKSKSILINPECHDDEGRTVVIRSFVVSGSIQGVQLGNLTDRIKLRFKIDDDATSPSCAFIEENIESGNWQWSKKGLTLDKYDNLTGMVECSSTHLTNFAVLSGFCMDPKSSIAKVLTHISIIGMVLSIICLSLVILCQIFFKKFRKGQLQIGLLNLSITLIIVNMLVIFGLNRTENRIGCIIIAALLHYLLLVSFAWMMVEAILQYLKFVKVFDTHVSNFMWKITLPAWVLPALVVGITAGVDYNLFRGPRYYCWLAKEAFYFAFLLPLGLIMVANIFIFIRIIKGISCDRPKGMQTNQTKTRLVWLQVQAGICCFVVMGLTWCFALFAFGTAAMVMYFLFAIFNSLQGFFIFILFNLREKVVRKAWYDLICRRKAGKKTTSSSDSSGFLTKDRNKNKKDDIQLTGTDAFTF